MCNNNNNNFYKKKLSLQMLNLRVKTYYKRNIYSECLSDRDSLLSAGTFAV